MRRMRISHAERALGFQSVGGKPELRRGRLCRFGDRRIPCLAEAEFLRGEFIGLTDLRIDQSPRSLPVKSDPAASDQRLRHPVFQRDLDRAKSFNVETGIEGTPGVSLEME